MIPATVYPARWIFNNNAVDCQLSTIEAGKVYLPFVSRSTKGNENSYFVDRVVSKHPKSSDVVHVKAKCELFKSAGKQFGRGIFHKPTSFPWSGGAVMHWYEEPHAGSRYYCFNEAVTTRNSASAYSVSVAMYRMCPTNLDVGYNKCKMHGLYLNVVIQINKNNYIVTRKDYRSISNEDADLYTSLILSSVKRNFEWIPYAILDDRVTPWEESVVEGLKEYFPPHNESYNFYWTSSGPEDVTPDTSSLQNLLLYAEDDYFYDGLSLEPGAEYWRRTFEEGAFLDALDHIPRANDNNISNIIEIVSMLSGLILRHQVEIPHSLQSAWLAYRYAYNTTKSDVDCAIDFINRRVETLERNSFKCYGYYTHIRDDGIEVNARCTMTVKLRELDTVANIAHKLRQYGLTPNFYVFWDLVPYSFIVDWFIPVGDILNAEYTLRKYKEDYDITNIYYSLTYDHGVGHVYSRWNGSIPPSIIGTSFFETRGSSTKTKTFRVLDALSLLTARF
jgi:hypothetical protein